MWTYVQATGEMWRDGNLEFYCYSGKGDGKNNPAMQSVHNIGPIPCGVYYPDHLFTTTDEHGPFAIRLKPELTNEMFGRSGFLLHGDSKAHPGEASEGCIVTSRMNREKVWATQEPIKVVARLQAVTLDVEALLFKPAPGMRCGGGVCSLADSLRLRSLGVEWDGSYLFADEQFRKQLKEKQ